MPKFKMERKDWASAKHKYLYSDRTHQDIADEYGISRQAVINGFKRNFPKIDWKVRKAEEKAKRESAKLSKAQEKSDIAKLKFDNKLDAVDEKHLDLIDMLLTQAMEATENGTIQPKNIKDIIELVKIHREINHKMASKTEVIVIRAEKPEEFEELPEVLDGEFEEVDD